jgi:hypothetical protein
VDVRSEHYNLAKWYDIIESALDDPDSEPIVNIADEQPANTTRSLLAGVQAAALARRSCVPSAGGR